MANENWTQRKRMKLEFLIKIILSVFLVICLFNMPYEYYELVRFLCLLGFSFLAFFSHKKKYNNLTILYIGLAILFQPIIKIYLGRFIWSLIDILTAIFLISTIFIKKKQI